MWPWSLTKKWMKWKVPAGKQDVMLPSHPEGFLRLQKANNYNTGHLFSSAIYAVVSLCCSAVDRYSVQSDVLLEVALLKLPCDNGLPQHLDRISFSNPSWSAPSPIAFPWGILPSFPLRDSAEAILLKRAVLEQPSFHGGHIKNFWDHNQPPGLMLDIPVLELGLVLCCSWIFISNMPGHHHPKEFWIRLTH